MSDHIPQIMQGLGKRPVSVPRGDFLPTWVTAAPVTWEMGLAGVVLWIGESIRHIGGLRARYPHDFWLWRVIDDADAETAVMATCAVAAVMVLVGLFMSWTGHGAGWRVRAAGLGAISAIFAFLAAAHLSVSVHSIAGVLFAFLGWRVGVVAALYWAKGTTCGQSR